MSTTDTRCKVCGGDRTLEGPKREGDGAPLCWKCSREEQVFKKGFTHCPSCLTEPGITPKGFVRKHNRPDAPAGLAQTLATCAGTMRRPVAPPPTKEERAARELVQLQELAAIEPEVEVEKLLLAEEKNAAEERLRFARELDSLPGEAARAISWGAKSLIMAEKRAEFCQAVRECAARMTCPPEITKPMGLLAALRLCTQSAERDLLNLSSTMPNSSCPFDNAIRLYQAKAMSELLGGLMAPVRELLREADRVEQARKELASRERILEMNAPTPGAAS